MMLLANPITRMAKNSTEPATRPTKNSRKKVASLKNGCSTLG